VFFYLLSVVPVVWFLELNETERRIELDRMRRKKRDRQRWDEGDGMRRRNRG